MCIVCVELVKQKMTILEAERNLGELGRTSKDKKIATHYKNLYDAIVEGDFKEVANLLEDTQDE